MGIENRVRQQFDLDIKNPDTQKVNKRLREIISDEGGLGVGILVAWQHGLHNKHIPTRTSLNGGVMAASGAQVIQISPDEVDDENADSACLYKFVHVPVRQFRRDHNKLSELKILDGDADPAGYVYHEDGLVGRFSFQKPQQVGLSWDDIEEILSALAAQGVLRPANLDNRQIQFKDIAIRRRIEESGERVYVRMDHSPLVREGIRLPYYDRDDVWKYVLKALQFRFACNYCSVEVLSPNEVTINSAHAFPVSNGHPDDAMAPVRNYKLGFTFSPIGNPDDVCHFLAWDFPHISDLVMNMEPQTYSFSDLIRLVRKINSDIAAYCDNRKISPAPEPISGGCNHWAGNSIYHQHYQFFRTAELPLLRVPTRLVVEHQGVQVRRVAAPWPAPAFIIRSTSEGGDENVMDVADRVAHEWRLLNDEVVEPYANKISIKNHTQNTLVTLDEDSQLIAVFIPRLRSLKDAPAVGGIGKENAGVLEMMGYLVIDDPIDFQKLQGMESDERKALGDAWLTSLSPAPAAVQEFENSLRICLTIAVSPFEVRIKDLIINPLEDAVERARGIAQDIKAKGDDLLPAQREHLYRELLWAVLESPLDPGVTEADEDSPEPKVHR